MSRAFFFKTLLRSSILNRKSRVLVAVISLVLGISLASALLNITFDVRERMGTEIRGYGANIILVPKDTTLQVGLGGLSFGSMSGEGFISEKDLLQIESRKSAENLVGYIPYLYILAEIGTQKIVLSGVWFDSLMRVNPSWKLRGEEIPDRNDMSSTLIGVNIAERFELDVGDTVEIRYEGRTTQLKIVGILSSGGSEDNQVFISLRLAQNMTLKNDSVHMVQLSYLVQRAELEYVARELAEVIPNVDVKVVSQVAEAEEAFLGKMQTVTAVLTIVVVAASAFAVMSTMSTTVLERRNEIGLLFALGATPRKIAELFLAEFLVIGLIGGFAGYFLGVGVATTMWLRIFNMVISTRPITFPAVVAIAIGVSFLASILPVRQALRVAPIVTLRGE